MLLFALGALTLAILLSWTLFWCGLWLMFKDMLSEPPPPTSGLCFAGSGVVSHLFQLMGIFSDSKLPSMTWEAKLLVGLAMLLGAIPRLWIALMVLLSKTGSHRGDIRARQAC